MNEKRAEDTGLGQIECPPCMREVPGLTSSTGVGWEDLLNKCKSLQLPEGPACFMLV